MGNSLDRARLLHDLIALTGRKARLARASADEEALDALLLEVERGRQARADPASAIDRAAGRSERYADLDLSFLDAALALEGAEGTDVARVVGRLTSAVLEEVAPPLQLAEDEKRRHRDDLADHWWVQVKSGQGWVDLDPSFADLALVPEVTLMPEALDEGLFHRVGLKLSLEIWRDGAPSESVVLDVVFAPQWFRNTPIRLLHVPEGLQDVAQFGTGDHPAEAMVDQLQAYDTWTPMIVARGGLVAQRAFTFDGEIFESPALEGGKAAAIRELVRLAETVQAPTARTFGGTTGFLGGLGSMMGGEEPAREEVEGTPSPAVVAAEWLDVTIFRPGEEPVVHRRPVFDILGAAARAAGQAPVIDQRALRTRVAGLATVMELLAVSSVPRADALLVEMAGPMASAYEDLASISERVAAGQDPIATASEPEPPLRSYLTAFSLLRFFALGERSASYLDRPNVVLLMTGIDVQPDGRAEGFLGLDVVENRVAIYPSQSDDAFELRVLQGVADTVIEGMLFGDLAEADNAAGRHGQALDRGVDWAKLGEATFSKGRAPLADGHALAAADVGRGYVVLGPVAEEGRLEGDHWWRIDPATGTTLGIGTPGRGKSLAEYGQLIYVGLDMGGHVLGLLGCFFQETKFKKFGWGQLVVETVNRLSCVAGHLIGIFAAISKL